MQNKEFENQYEKSVKEFEQTLVLLDNAKKKLEHLKTEYEKDSQNQDILNQIKDLTQEYKILYAKFIVINKKVKKLYDENK